MYNNIESPREFAIADKFKDDSQESAYIEACINLVKKEIVNNTAVAEEDVYICNHIAMIVHWNCKASFSIAFRQKTKQYTGLVAPAQNLLRVKDKRELEEKTSGFLLMEKERPETILDVAEELKSFRIGQSLSPKRFRTHPMLAVWERTCPPCNGYGEVTCGNCNGNGSVNCSNCGASGTVACNTCGGQGEVTCSYCYGSATQNCSVWNCNVGYISCRSCGGRGNVHQYNGEHRCSVCGGGGRQRCYSCNGSGHEQCHHCSWGKVHCQSCGASGKRTCPNCSGQGEVRCPECRGKGQVTCENCDGTGTIHSIGQAYTEYTGELHIPKLHGLFFEPHTYYVETYRPNGPSAIDMQEKRIDMFFGNSVPFCCLEVRPFGREPGEGIFELGLHGEQPQIHEKKKYMPKILDAFIKDRVKLFAEQGKNASLLTSGFTRDTAEQLSSFLKIPIVAASFTHDGKSEQGKKALEAIKHRLRLIKRHILIQGLGVHFFMITVVAFIFSYVVTNFDFISRLNATHDTQVKKETLLLIYSLAQGCCIALGSRIYSGRYVFGISKSIHIWAQKYSLLYGTVETLVLLVCGAVVSVFMPLGV